MKNKDDAGTGTFILRCDFYRQVKLLSREQRGDLLTSLFAYTSGEDMPPLDDMTAMCFEFIKVSIDTYSEKYNARCHQNRENGKRGGRPKKADADKPTGIECNREKPKKTERFINYPNETKRDLEKAPFSPSFPFPPITPISHYTPISPKRAHTVDTTWKGVVGGNQTAGFLDRLASAHPRIAAMAEPITDVQASDIMAKFSAEDINRIFEAMDNKGAYRNKSAYSTFASFVAHDIIIKSRKATADRKFTYNEVIAEVDGGRGTWDDFQFLAMPDGTKYWMRKIDISAIQA